MSKIQISLCTLIAVLAWSALSAAGASATLWLKNGASVTTATAASIHGTLVMRHEGGVLGNTDLECSGLTTGTVGPGAESSGTLVESLSGERDLVRCHVIQGFCSETIDHPLKLPWGGKLVLIGGETFDEIVVGTKTPESEALCASNPNLTLTCTVKGKAKFVRNTANGAEFEVTKALTETTCSDGGKGWAEGKESVLGFTIS